MGRAFDELALFSYGVPRRPLRVRARDLTLLRSQVGGSMLRQKLVNAINVALGIARSVKPTREIIQVINALEQAIRACQKVE
jgi:hypothetical protein